MVSLQSAGAMSAAVILVHVLETNHGKYLSKRGQQGKEIRTIPDSVNRENSNGEGPSLDGRRLKWVRTMVSPKSEKMAYLGR